MTLSIIATNVIVFVLSQAIGTVNGQGLEYATIAFGHIPSVSNDLRSLPVAYQLVPDDWYAVTTITSAFMHADIWHLGGNMLFLWVLSKMVVR